MITVTLPNVVEPSVDWSAPFDAQDAMRIYGRALFDASPSRLVDDATDQSERIELFCAALQLVGGTEHWSAA